MIKTFRLNMSQITFSDDEEDSFESANDWPTFTIRFGKFKGRTLTQMIETGKGRSYLRYIAGWKDVRPGTLANITMALEYYKSLKIERDKANLYHAQNSGNPMNTSFMPATADMMQRYASGPPLQAPQLTRTDTQM